MIGTVRETEQSCAQSGTLDEILRYLSQSFYLTQRIQVTYSSPMAEAEARPPDFWLSDLCVSDPRAPGRRTAPHPSHRPPEVGRMQDKSGALQSGRQGPQQAPPAALAKRVSTWTSCPVSGEYEGTVGRAAPDMLPQEPRAWLFPPGGFW